VSQRLLHGALTEPVIAPALEDELLARGHRVTREVRVGVWYEGREIGTQRLDMIVDDVLIIEVKAMAEIHPAAFRQVHSYLRATRLELGLIVHFGPTPTVQRVIFTNDHTPPRGQRVRSDRCAQD